MDDEKKNEKTKIFTSRFFTSLKRKSRKVEGERVNTYEKERETERQTESFVASGGF